MKLLRNINRKLVAAGVVLFCLALVGLVLFLLVRSPIPPNIAKQVTYPVFLPSKGVDINGRSYKFDTSQKVLSFLGTLSDGQMVTFTEQSTPAPFYDIPNFYTQFLQTLYQYQDFDSLQGTVYLTHPKGAGQAAVLNAKGTLLFARVANDEPVDTWQLIFNHLSIYNQ